jgi:NDP-sugar pyrophosphorylase family protein
MKGVVLAGGQGTRLAPYTKILPKPLMPIGDMPILEVLLRQMARAGIDEVILTVGYLAELLRAFFQEGKRCGLQLHYSYEDQPLGTAGPLSLIEGLESTFLVCNGDVLTNLDFRDLFAAHEQMGAAATIATHLREVKVNLGVVQFDGNQEIIGYIEKPRYEFQVSMGIYVFEPRVLKYIPVNQFLDFPDLILKLIEAGERVQGYPFSGYWQDLGRPDDYEKAVHDFEKYKLDFLGEPETEN